MSKPIGGQMPKYEIMLIVDPSTTGKVVENLSKNTFKGSVNFKVMERTELAYEINKSKTGKYLLLNVEANGEDVAEFTRKINIEKTV
ncbi:MAG: 30S ribosomal protein S6 [Tenericutes bacterium]|nr:MAG: 30S ribosomal protein S6 [Mycoplasmatota bacterium]